MSDLANSKRVLVFGAAGFVGGYLIRELVSHGYEVHASDLHAGADLGGAQAFHPCDLLDEQGVCRIVEAVQPDHIVNLAALSSVGLSWKAPSKTVEINVCGAIHLLEAARRYAPQAKILLIGSSEEYAVSSAPLAEDAPLAAGNPYGLSKWMQESFAELYRSRYGLHIQQARAFNHTGVGQADAFVVPSWCRQAAQISLSGSPGEMRVGNTAVSRDFCHVADVVRAYRLMLERGESGDVYNVGSGTPVLLKELLSYIVSLSCQPITVKTDEKLFRPADQPVICCDSSRIRARLGWEPQYTIYDAVRQMFDFYLDLFQRR